MGQPNEGCAYWENAQSFQNNLIISRLDFLRSKHGIEEHCQDVYMFLENNKHNDINYNNRYPICIDSSLFGHNKAYIEMQIKSFLYDANALFREYNLNGYTTYGFIEDYLSRTINN